jgi:hypothetical protein
MAATPDPEEALLIRTVLYGTVTRAIDCCVANHCRQSQKATYCMHSHQPNLISTRRFSEACGVKAMVAEEEHEQGGP